MSDKITSDSSSVHKHYLIVLLLIYAIFAFVFGYAYRYAINPDGIPQLRLAGYIAEGHFQQSISSGWSPLFIWLVSPFLYFGFDGLTSARITIALNGAGLLICSWLLSLRFDLSQKSRFIALLIAALLISDWSIRFIEPDLIVAALIIYYVYLATNSNILNDKKISFYCGIVGGFSYLAHHYAFPFFLAHFPSMLLLRGYIDKVEDGFPLKKVLKSWGAGIAGFLIIVSLWVGVVSVNYGHLTISSKGGVINATVGPPDVDRRPPHFYGGLNKPNNEYALHVFEDISGLKFKTWSPFESKKYFKHQLKLIKDNALYILNHFVNLSPFFTYAFVTGILFFVPIALLLNPLTNSKKYLYFWGILTFSIYCSGFLLLLARSPRRFYALMIVFLFISFHFVKELENAFKDIVYGRRRKMLSFYLLLIVISAFALKPGMHLLQSLRNIITIDQVNPYRDIAEQIDTVPFPSPYAIIRSSQKPPNDLYIAYYIGKQLLGRPLSTDVDGITAEMEAAGAKSLVVFDNLEIAEKLRGDMRYVLLASKRLKKDDRYLYAVNIEQDEIKGWDEEVNIFRLK